MNFAINRSSSLHEIWVLLQSWQTMSDNMCSSRCLSLLIIDNEIWIHSVGSSLVSHSHSECQCGPDLNSHLKHFAGYHRQLILLRLALILLHLILAIPRRLDISGFRAHDRLQTIPLYTSYYTFGNNFVIVWSAVDRVRGRGRGQSSMWVCVVCRAIRMSRWHRRHQTWRARMLSLCCRCPSLDISFDMNCVCVCYA